MSLPTVIFVPSSGGSSQSAFYKSSGEILSQNGFEVIYFDIAEKNLLSKDAWQKPLQGIKDKIDQETCIISHSNGTFAVSRFLSDNDIKIKSWHIVASAFDPEIITSKSGDFAINQAKNLLSQEQIDWTKLNQNCESIVLHYSKDDLVVNFKQWEKYREKLPKAILQKYENYGHFGAVDFPELANFIINQEKNSWTEINQEKYRVKLLDPEKLPLILPDVQDYQPNVDGKSPLSKTDWIEVKNSEGKTVARYESDVMPNWAGSSWYYLRYTDPKNEKEFAGSKNLDYWLPVDHYFGGNEHTTMHLLYSRFWHRFLYDQGRVPTSEPYQKRTNGGILLGPDGQKMSKSKGNVVNIKEKLNQVGADAVRLYVAFIGPYDSTVIWNDGGLKACKRLVDSIFELHKKVSKLETKNKNLIPSLETLASITELEQKMKNSDKKIIVDSLIANQKGEIFAQKRSSTRKLYPNCWDVAGGHLEEGETLLDCLQREVREETGFEIAEILKIVNIEEQKDSLVVSFLVTIINPDVGPVLETEKVTEYKWINRQNLEILKENYSNSTSNNLVYRTIKKALTITQPEKYLVFDFDGVLGDTFEAWGQTRGQALGLSLDEAKQIIIDRHTAPRHARSNNLSPEEVQKAIQDVLDHSKIAATHKASLFTDFIDEIKKIPNAELAVVSSGSTEIFIKPMLQDAGLKFTHILGIEDSHSKEEKIEQIIKDWEIDASKVFYFTDTKGDVLELENMLDRKKLIGCSWGWHGQKLLEEILPKNQVLNSPSDIHKILSCDSSDLQKDSVFLVNLLDSAKKTDRTANIHLIIKRKDGKILAQHRRKDREVFPDMWEASIYGKVEPGETLYEAIERELQEETGWKLVKIRQYLQTLDWDFQDQWKNATKPLPQQRTFSFLIEASGDLDRPILENQNVDDFKWIDAKEMNLFDNNLKQGETWTKNLVQIVLQNDQISDFILDKKSVDQTNVLDSKLLSSYHKFVKNITSGIQDHKNNVVVAEIMSFVNLLKEQESIPFAIWSGFLQVLAPFASFTAEELWYDLHSFDNKDYTKSVHLTSWPAYKPELCVDDMLTIAVQINGKLRSTIMVEKDLPEAEIITRAKEKAAKWLEGKEIKFQKVIPKKMVTFAVK